MNLPLDLLLVVAVLGFVGGLVQGTVGFGFAVVASPLIALVRPDLVPVAILVAVVPLPIAAVVAEWRHVDWRSFAWVVAGRLPAVAVGVAVVALVSTRVLEAVIGASVLLMVLLSVVRVRIPRTPATLLAAGAVGGVFGTASGIGGPPVAIVLAQEEPPVARATLGAIFVAGSLLSLAGLGLAGQITVTTVAPGLAMIPTTMLGFAASLWARRRVSRPVFRAAVMAVSGIAALVLLVRAAIG